MGFTAIAVSTLLLVGAPGTFFDYKVEVSYDAAITNGVLSLPKTAGYDATATGAYTPQISIFQPVNINAPIAKNGELVNLAGNQNTCTVTQTGWQCRMPKTGGVLARTFYVRVKSDMNIMSTTTLAAPAFTATATGVESMMATGPAHTVSTTVDQATIAYRFTATTLRYDALDELQTMVNTFKTELGMATSNPAERFQFYSVDTPEGNILLDGYVTGPTAAQWMADSAEGAAPPAAGTAAAGAVCRDGDRALNPETGLPSKTGICSATALANSLVEQAKFASSALHLNNAGDAMAWGWQLKPGSIVSQCADGSFTSPCVAPVSSDDDLEDAVMIAAIAIGAVVLLGLGFACSKIRSVKNAKDAEAAKKGQYNTV